MPRAVFATGHAARAFAGDSERVLVNMYAEPNESDPARPIKLMTTPGTMDKDAGNVIQGNIRAMAQEDAFASGKVLVLDGTTLRTWVPSTGTFGTITGTVTGTDRADVAISQTELAILSGGTVYVSAGTTIAAATDVDFPSGITSVTVMSQRLLMTTTAGQFFYSSVLDFDDITGLNFYTAEGSPDNLVAVRRWAEMALMFGTETLEMWYSEPSNADDPFSRASSVVPTGCKARDTIAITSYGPVWVDPENNVVLLIGAQTQTISPPWLSRLIAAETATNLIASTYKAEGDEFYVLNGLGFCAVLKGGTQDWHLRKTDSSDTWAFSRILTAGGAQYATKRTGTAFMHLSRDYATDEQADAETLGTDITREFTAHIPHDAGRPALGPIMVDGSKGGGLAAGDGSAPVIQMRISTDNGNTWSSFRSRKLGAQGAYDERSKWNQNGRGRRPQTILHFKIVEPVAFTVTGVTWGEAS